MMLEDLIDGAMRNKKADIAIKNINILSTITGEIKKGDIAIVGDTIVGVYDEYNGNIEIDGTNLYAVPGFIDCHCHVESSLLTPFEFERCVIKKGTTTAVCDPHELSNVVGKKAIEYFLDASKKLTMDLKVALSSCVPATHMETAGATVSPDEILMFKDDEKSSGLGEMMNYPGVLFKDKEVLRKIKEAKHVDGHAPLVSEYALNAYLSVGIDNDHETTSMKEMAEKLNKGMHIFMREGTLCKDLKNLYPLANEFNSIYMSICSDDRNPLEIKHEGHMDFLIRTMIKGGIKPAVAYRIASLSGAFAFNLKDRGVIAPGKRADIVILNNLENVDINQVIANGKIVNDSLFNKHKSNHEFAINSVKIKKVSEKDFVISDNIAKTHIIGIIPDKIITEHLITENIEAEKDIAKICVFHRHGKNENVGKGYVKGFKFLKEKIAIASTIGHDSHNLCVIGNCDKSMMVAVNHIIDMGGGFVLVDDDKVVASLALPIGGLMSDDKYENIADKLEILKTKTKELVTGTSDVFLQMGFLPLAVIPHLKLTDMGLVNVDKFEIIRK